MKSSDPLMTVSNIDAKFEAINVNAFIFADVTFSALAIIQLHKAATDYMFNIIRIKHIQPSFETSEAFLRTVLLHNDLADYAIGKVSTCATANLLFKSELVQFGLFLEYRIEHCAKEKLAGSPAFNADTFSDLNKLLLGIRELLA